MTTTTPGLVTKLAEVMAAVERIPKRGRNDFHKYDYATEADIAAAIRAELARRHVMLFPAIVSETRCVIGEKGSVLTTLDMEMEFIDGETGESIKKPWRGYGSDKDDKGGYKAMTGGEKYFLLKTFLMPTGDDPENDKPENDKKPPKPPDGAEDWLTDLTAVAENGTVELRKAWKASKPEYRTWLTDTQPQTIDTLKLKAERVHVELPA